MGVITEIMGKVGLSLGLQQGSCRESPTYPG